VSTGLGLSVSAQAAGVALPMSTDGSTMVSSDASKAEIMKGRFAALLAAIEFGEEDAPSAGESQASTEAPQHILPNATPFVSDEGAELARLRHWIAEMVEAPTAEAAPVGTLVSRAAHDASVAVRDLEALHPELKIRVERVVTRMREEYGHRVEVVETIRSQERQDALYAQGRTAPGERVTWTRESLHQHGRAADLQVDGSWSNREAYARLQKIAQEEGLSTIGARDGGHVEWRDGSELAARRPMTKPTQDAGLVAQVAQVARPSRVAAVAVAAPVADVARIGAASAAARKAAEPRAVAEPREPFELREPSTIEPRTSSTVTDLVSNVSAPAGTAFPAIGVSPEATPRFDARTATESLAAGSQIQRIEDIDALDDARRGQPLQSITLRVEDAEGQDHRIRVDLRGGEVHADITAASGSQARAISEALPELRQRLGAQGLDTAAVHVRTWLSDQPSNGERSTPQRDSQHQRQDHHQQQSDRNPRQSHQSPRPWYDVEGETS
jgi:hypothetical protein